jgi:signal transduction histidine kinase
MIRLLLLLLITVCGFGVQVLFDKRRRAEEEAREFALRQEQLRVSGRLAGEIAHRLKNPLGIINNAAFNLQRNLREGKATITQQIRIIREEVDRSDRIITDLMGYARLAEGRIEKLTINDELDSAITQVFPAHEFDVEIERRYALGLPALLMQRSHLSEILINLLFNARQAMEGRGRVTVITRYETNALVISISDTGSGIPPDLQDKIFEPYFTTKEKGSGLGLAIVKHNTEIYDGTVSLQSELGKGTTFILTFPVRSLMKLRR